MDITLLVIDSFGIGAMPDAAEYGDAGANTALHICERVAGDKWPNLQKLGLGNASKILGPDLPGCEAVGNPLASYGVMAERSPGKDTTTGHWELAGVVLDKPFPTFPPEYPSFPAVLTDAFQRRTGRGVLGNYAASGTVIIQDLGDEHRATGKPIVYTSSDSVFQIAAHEEVIPVEEFYRICEIARELCDDYRIGRVIARPFTGTSGAYTRTERRRDFSMPPVGQTVLDLLFEQGIETIGIGKIGDIFCERGITTSHHDKGNTACLERTLGVLKRKAVRDRFIFVNLVDTDMIYGHRRDAAGYSKAVSQIDAALPGMMETMDDDDILILSADHGCDPTFAGTDHTREYVPVLWYAPGRDPADLGIRKQFCDVARSVCEAFRCEKHSKGEAFF
ncbi:MAG: phosphopentomutase [Spirochaetales bacterium]|nr:phosphopentomutase [Spirochaetales bacterium]